jgi:hypothetical protein
VFDRTIEQFQEGTDYFSVPSPVWSQWDSGCVSETQPGLGGHSGEKIALTESGTRGGPSSNSRR